MTEYELNYRYKTNSFINRPNFESNIKIVLDETIQQADVFFSIVIPVHNQQDIIVRNIESIFVHTTEKKYEVILILDSCEDNTETRILEYFNTLDKEVYPLLTKILILKSEIPLFETSCDNLGFFCAKGQYLLEIQADMKMTQMGYNMKLLQPFLKRTDMLGISGRCCHSFTTHQGIGKLGMDIETSLCEIKNVNVDSFYIGETCNRGPLLLDNRKCKELGYFDECNYFLDDSDHDLFARGYLQKQWVCGYVPIEFSSPLSNGSTRKKRNELNETYYQLKKHSTQNGRNGFLKQNLHKLLPREIERYKIE
jgi:hypothetical protein